MSNMKKNKNIKKMDEKNKFMIHKKVYFMS